MNSFRKSILIITLILSGIWIMPGQAVYAQKAKHINWSVVTMDSTWTPGGRSASHKIIAKYKPTIDSLHLVIGHSKKELVKNPPESPLSNLAADIILSQAQKYLDKNGINEKVDMALTNFGGIRTSLPKGDVSVADVLSVFPFDNRIVILEIEGKYISQLIENFAKRNRVEALSGVELVIRKNEVEKFLIGGKPVDDAKTYRLATIDFLFKGGDSVYTLKYANDAIETGIILRDAVIEYIKDLTAGGKDIDAESDARVIIKK